MVLDSCAGRESFMIFLTLMLLVLLKILVITHFSLTVHLLIYFAILVALFLFLNLPTGTFPFPGNTVVSPALNGRDSGAQQKQFPYSATSFYQNTSAGVTAQSQTLAVSSSYQSYAFYLFFIAAAQWLLMCTIFENFQHIGAHLWFGMIYRSDIIEGSGSGSGSEGGGSGVHRFPAHSSALGISPPHLSVWYHYCRDVYLLMFYLGIPLILFLRLLTSKNSRDKSPVFVGLITHYQNRFVLAVGLGSVLWFPLFTEDSFYGMSSFYLCMKLLFMVPMHYNFQLYHSKITKCVRTVCSFHWSTNGGGSSSVTTTIGSGISISNASASASSATATASTNSVPNNSFGGDISSSQMEFRCVNALQSVYYSLYMALFLLPPTLSMCIQIAIVVISHKEIMLSGSSIGGGGSGLSLPL